MKHLCKFNESDEWSNILGNIKPVEWGEIKYTGSEPNLKIKILFDKFGNPIRMSDNDIETVEKMLSPYKDRESGCHDDTEFRNYGNGPIEYPPVNWKHTNCRGGFTWMLIDPDGNFNVFTKSNGEIIRTSRYRGHGIKLEVAINSFPDGWYVIKIDPDRDCPHNSNQYNPPKMYICDTIEGVVDLITKKVLSKY